MFIILGLNIIFYIIKIAIIEPSQLYTNVIKITSDIFF